MLLCSGPDRSKRWVVARFEQGLARLLRYENGRLRSFSCSPQHLITVEHPTFALGEKVILSDRNEGTVLADDGIGTVRVKGPDRLPIRDGAFYVTGFSGGEHDADRANLILDNRKV